MAQLRLVRRLLHLTDLDKVVSLHYVVGAVNALWLRVTLRCGAGGAFLTAQSTSSIADLLAWSGVGANAPQRALACWFWFYPFTLGALHLLCEGRCRSGGVQPQDHHENQLV